MNEVQPINAQTIEKPAVENQSEFWSEIIPELRVDEGGVGYASVRAVARLCGVRHTTLVNHFRGGSLKTSFLSKTLAGHGFNGGSFSANGIPDKAIAIIVQYYAMDAGPNCREEAKACLKAFLAIGIRTWMHQLTGYKPPQPDPQPAPQPNIDSEPFPPNVSVNIPRVELDTITGCIVGLIADVKALKGKNAELDGDYFDLMSYQKYQSDEHKRQLNELNSQIQGLKLQIADRGTAEMPDTPELIRAEIKSMVNYSAFDNDRDHRKEWVRLYQEFGRQYGIEVEPEEGESRIDAFARQGLLKALHRVARLLFGYRAS